MRKFCPAVCIVRGLSGSFTSEAVWVPSPASPPVQGQTRLAKKAAAAAEEEEEASAPPAWVGWGGLGVACLLGGVEWKGDCLGGGHVGKKKDLHRPLVCMSLSSLFLTSKESTNE